MNFVAIDPSLSCTAMVVNDKKFVYTTPTVASTKKGDFKRWFEACDGLATIRVFKEVDSKEPHSSLEFLKLRHYYNIAAHIVDDITSNMVDGDTYIAIEGYSYSSAAGPLIDLVTLGTLLRYLILARVRDGTVSVEILQPTEVKQKAAALVYPAIKKGKKVEYRNADGVAGGSFKKPEIYKALIDNSKLLGDEWVEFIRGHSDEILEMKSIPKPIEDINDAKTLYEILKAAYSSDK